MVEENLELKQRLLGLVSSGDYLIKVRPAGRMSAVDTIAGCGGNPTES